MSFIDISNKCAMLREFKYINFLCLIQNITLYNRIYNIQLSSYKEKPILLTSHTSTCSTSSPDYPRTICYRLLAFCDVAWRRNIRKVVDGSEFPYSCTNEHSCLHYKNKTNKYKCLSLKIYDWLIWAQIISNKFSPFAI